MDSCFPTALGNNQPLATFWDLPFSHSDASISRKSHLVTISKALKVIIDIHFFSGHYCFHKEATKPCFPIFPMAKTDLLRPNGAHGPPIYANAFEANFVQALGLEVAPWTRYWTPQVPIKTSSPVCIPQDERLNGGYENVPTVDIHMNQIEMEEQWMFILNKYIVPLSEKVFQGYISEVNFIRRVHIRGKVYSAGTYPR